MNKLKDYIKYLFRKSESTKPEIPFLHELIDLDQFDLDAYNEWSLNESALLINTRLKTAFLNFEIHKESLDSSIEFWFQPLSKGLIIFNNAEYELERFDFINLQYRLYLLFKEKGYYLNLADIQSRQKAGWIEIVRRFYLKPSSKFRNGKKAHQLFGNIHLEYLERDEKPYMFRLLANSYRDQNFHEEEDFRDLILLITG